MNDYSRDLGTMAVVGFLYVACHMIGSGWGDYYLDNAKKKEALADICSTGINLNLEFCNENNLILADGNLVCLKGVITHDKQHHPKLDSRNGLNCVAINSVDCTQSYRRDNVIVNKSTLEMIPFQLSGTIDENLNKDTPIVDVNMNEFQNAIFSTDKIGNSLKWCKDTNGSNSVTISDSFTDNVSKQYLSSYANGLLPFCSNVGRLEEGGVIDRTRERTWFEWLTFQKPIREVTLQRVLSSMSYCR